jgi:hypothetical protein
MKKIILAIIAGVMATSAAHAARGYGTAGCGLGSVVFQNQPGMIQILAATTNGTFYSQTFGITTGTSNCVDDGAVAQAKELDLYVEVNHSTLSTEAARGNGESIRGLAQIMGCSDSAVVAQTMKKNYGAIFASGMESYDSAAAIRTVMKSDANVAAGCTKLI